MIWLDHSQQFPAGSDQGLSPTINGVSFEIWSSGINGMGSGTDKWTCISYVNKGTGIYTNSAFNLKDIIKDAVTRFSIPGTYYLSAIEFGNEVINGSGMLEIGDWSITVQ